MKRLLLNQTCVFHLTKMAFRAQNKYKKRYHLTEEDDLIALIKFADITNDIELRRNFMLFYINCPDDIKDYLESEHGIHSPMERYQSLGSL
ncbi:hypothetical protein [Alkalimarinus alittae]|uniref:Uncharacterized protein n=1 Tax=Alkalimarinus alittae TaxID=2961619 RepID=A0ABY6N6A7_9ALTE|nr:hypothetical protein [Alkalimarinus alittae]UZE97661.1 hypothetical protein NKI27_07980 [Alkalimarinus alittae]